MLDGIDYYPSKGKKEPQRKIRILALIIILLGGYSIFEFLEEPIKESEESALIIISKGEKQTDEVADSIIIKSNQVYQPRVDYRVKSNKGLDELIHTLKDASKE